MKLYAILIGLRKIPDDANVVIVSDDEYAVKATLGLSKRNHNLDILEMIDAEIRRFGKLDYRWINDKNAEDKLRQKYCTGLAQKGTEIGNYINVADYYPLRCREKANDMISDGDEAMQVIMNIEKEIKALRNFLKKQKI